MDVRRQSDDPFAPGELRKKMRGNGLRVHQKKSRSRVALRAIDAIIELRLWSGRSPTGCFP
jgi:hypothetical protein